MKTKSLYMASLLVLLSCGKKSIIESSFLGGSDSRTTADAQTASNAGVVDERNCIDKKLTIDLDSGESIAKMVVNTDVTFCNGVRLRLKTYQFISKKYKAYGFVRSNSGRETCIEEANSLTHKWKLGDDGVLEGQEIKILLGGHQFDSDNKVIPSEHRLARRVTFEWGSYNGEMAIYEKGKVRCWAIQ